MTLAINQPYFFPYVGYFSLIMHSDKFIVFDTPQYVRHGWINRNRILKPDGQDWQYITVPLKKHARECSIMNIEVRDDSWKDKLLGQLQHYKKKGRYYPEVQKFLYGALSFDSCRINEINVHLLKAVCDFLEIEFDFELYSRMNLVHDEPSDAWEWSLLISEAAGADVYVNLPGKAASFDKEKFLSKNIDLGFIQADLGNYRNQRPEVFYPGLSILDVLIYKGRVETKKIIANYKIVKPAEVMDTD